MGELTDAQRLQVVAEIWSTPCRAPDGFGLLHEYRRRVKERILSAETGAPEPPFDLARLERLARDATPGRWEAILEDDPRGQPVPYYRALVAVLAQGDQRLSVVATDVETVPVEQWRANTEFIAAASPETVLRLIAAMRTKVTE